VGRKGTGVRLLWELTEGEIDAMPAGQRRSVLDQIAYLKNTGALAVILANPGSKFETVYDKDLGWKLRPIERAKK
jgi:hypothetical protein